MLIANSRVFREQSVFTEAHFNDLFIEIGRVLQSIAEDDQNGITVCEEEPQWW